MNVVAVRNRNAGEISEYWHFRIFDGAAKKQTFVITCLSGHLERKHPVIPAILRCFIE